MKGCIAFYFFILTKILHTSLEGSVFPNQINGSDSCIQGRRSAKERKLSPGFRCLDIWKNSVQPNEYIFFESKFLNIIEKWKHALDKESWSI